MLVNTVDERAIKVEKECGLHPGHVKTSKRVRARNVLDAERPIRFGL
jgi:hypothetical protein